MKKLKRKEKILSFLLSNSRFYDMTIYKIIMDGCLDDIIDTLDDEKVVSNVDKKKVIEPEEQFLTLLNRFVNYFKKNFKNLDDYTDVTIIEIISSNPEEFKEYLNGKMYIGDNNYINYFKKILPKLCILNFVNNAQMFPELQQVLKQNKIPLKTIDNYKDKEIIKIFELLCDIVCCSKHAFWNFEFFHDYEYSIQKGIKELQNSKLLDLSNTSIEEFKVAMFNHEHVKYESLLECYNKKKDILNKLKNID